MARKTDRKKDQPAVAPGKLPPRYHFFLNPYNDVRFSTACPRCAGKTRLRKIPLAIHVVDWGMVLLNKSCRLCVSCELLIAHQDEVEAQLGLIFERLAPQVIGNEYLAIGTVERKVWQRGRDRSPDPKEQWTTIYPFKDLVHFKPAPTYTVTPPLRAPARPR
jgi:hypothetical protein